MTGQIPEELGGFRQLQRLYLGGNKFTGCIPASWCLVEDHDLATLGLPFCLTKTTGALQALYDDTGGDNWHDNMGWCTNQPLSTWSGLNDGSNVFRRIKLPDNNLVGTLPPELGDLDRLVSLDLSGNHLTGEIPSVLGDLRTLAALDLSKNDLTGPIPQELGGIETPGRLDLSDNQLTGPIPPELGGMDGPFHLNLANNQLTGLIPRELVSTRALRFLDLSGNNLTGEIPAKLGQLNRNGMRVLRLSGNNFTGCIPDALRPAPDNDLPTTQSPDLKPAFRGARPALLRQVTWYSRRSRRINSQGQASV